MEQKYTSPVITVDPNDSIFQTLQKMQLNFIKRVVVAVDNKPVGIVTERDINHYLENDKTVKALDEIPIKNVMEKNIISITDGQDDRFNQCSTRMETFKIGSVIMVNQNGELIGIVSKTDITKAFSVVYGGKYKVKDYMNEKVITCRKSDSLKFALSMMNTNHISRLVVTDEDGTPLGLISTNTFLTHSDYFSKGQTRSRDYLLSVSNQNLRVEDLLDDELLTVEPEEDLASAASMMIKNKIGGIPVVSNKKLIGILTKDDIVKAFSVVGSHEYLRSKYKEFY